MTPAQSTRPRVIQGLKQIRGHPIPNRLGRAVIRAAADGAEWARRRWPVAGNVAVEVCGERLVLASEGDDNLASDLYYRRAWDVFELQAWGALMPRNGSTILDIGANTGVYSLLAGRLRPDAWTIAVEPNPINVERLERNLRINSVKSVEIVPAAASSAPGTASLSVPAIDRISDVSSLSRRFSEAHYGIDYAPIEVPVTTVDAITEGRTGRRVGLIKIDVESHEFPVLKGAIKTLEEHGPPVLCEVVDPEVFCAVRPDIDPSDLPGSRQEVEGFLAELNYQAFRITRHGAQSTSELRGGGTGVENFLFIRDVGGRPTIAWQELSGLQQH